MYLNIRFMAREFRPTVCYGAVLRGILVNNLLFKILLDAYDVRTKTAREREINYKLDLTLKPREVCLETR